MMEPWGLVVGIAGIIAAAAVFLRDVQTIRKLELEIKRLKCQIATDHSHVHQPTREEIDKYTRPSRFRAGASSSLLALFLLVSGIATWRLYHLTGALANTERTTIEAATDAATSLRALGDLYAAQGLYDRAEPLYRRALAIQEKTLGADHPQVATSLADVAALRAQVGDYAAARQLYERALAIQEKTLGPTRPEVATTLSNLGNVLKDSGDYAAAREYYERALAIRRAMGNTSDYANSLNNLGELYAARAQYEQAEALHKEALAIQEKALGPKHPDVARTLADLALVYRATGRIEAAEKMEVRLADILSMKRRQ